MAPPAVGTGTLRRLGELDTDGHPGLSVYLDLDCARSPSAVTRDGELDGLIAGVDRRAAQADSSRVRQILRSLPGLAYGTRGIAMFSSAGGSTHEAVQLPSPVVPMAIVDTIPWLEPLAAMLTTGEWGAAVLGRHTGRLFRGGPQTLVEFAAFEGGRHSAPGRGGLRRTRRRQGSEEQGAEPERQLAGRLLRAHRRQAFEHLVVVASSERLAVTEAVLHSDLRDRLAGTVARPDLEHAPAPEILCAVAPILARARRDASTQGRHVPALPMLVSAVGTHQAAKRFLHQLQRAGRTTRGEAQPTRSIRWRTPRTGQEEDAACP